MAIDKNIVTPILNALMTLSQAELIDPYPLADKLRLKRLQLAPLQDDPTKVAPYWIFGPDPDFRIRPHGPAEIGGAQYWIYGFRGTCGTPRATSRETAYELIEELTARIDTMIQEHFDLSGISAPGSLQAPSGLDLIDGMDPSQMWGGTHLRTYGGSQEWYGEALLFWCYSVRRERTWKIFN